MSHTPDEARMDAVLPLTLRDLPRAAILFESLALRFEGLGTLWVVCPDEHAREIEAALARADYGLSFQVQPETALVPELGLTPWLRGWYRQQLVKLAIHERVASEFYLTLDADVICARSVCPEALTPGGLGLCHVIESELHPDWYAGSEAVLGLERPRTGILHNVTPAVLHRDAVRELAGHLRERSERGEFAPGARGMMQRFLRFRARRAEVSPWRAYLAAGAPWTEYALYYTFLEATGRFERFHRYSPECIYDVERSVWRDARSSFSAWNPDPSFLGAGPPWFVIVQSNTAIPPSEVREKLGRHLVHA